MQIQSTVFHNSRTGQTDRQTDRPAERLSLPKIIDIDQYLLNLFENISGVRFLWTTVYMYNT